MNTESPALELRRASPADASDIAAYMADPRVYGQLLQLPHPSESLWQDRLASPAAAGGVDISLVAQQAGKVVGMASLFGSGPVRRQHACGLGISVAAWAQGQGIGRALMSALIDYADRWTPLQRIELTVFADNLRAQQLYRRYGFVEEGRLRGYAIRDGAFADCLSMARWRPEPGSSEAP